MTTATGLRVDALLAGKARPYTRPGSMSAIDKQPLAGTVRIGELGIAGDEQGDTRVHGGPDKAVHHYPFEHYATWRAELGGLPALASPGAFGENIVVRNFRCLSEPLAIHGFKGRDARITQALIERKGAKTGLLTTEGFRDIAELGTILAACLRQHPRRRPNAAQVRLALTKVATALSHRPWPLAADQVTSISA